MLMYQRVYEILKNKIEGGLLPAGASLPSRAALACTFGISEKTVRRVMAMLEADGLVETAQRKRPVVAARRDAGHLTTALALKKIDADMTSDVLKTGVLLCYPVIKKGIARCERTDLQIPRRILENMEIGSPPEFWKLSKQFYRFFVARNENALIVQAVDSLGLSDLKPLHDDIEMRTRYYRQLQQFMTTLETGGAPESVHFDDMSGIYGTTAGGSAFQASADSPLLLGRKQLEKTLREADERYSAVYMDIIGLIAAGRYRRGDRLPSHKELQAIYGVSVDTTRRAIQILRDLGVVRTVRGSGIFVEMNRDGIRQITLPPHLIACHVRRYLDTLELLALTAEGAAACAAAQAAPSAVQAAQAEIDRLWNRDYLYGRSPAVLLDFIVRHIGIDAFSVIYVLLQRNFRIGRSIPGLLTTEKTALNCEIHQQCVDTVKLLSAGSREAFAARSADLFERIRRLVIEACRRLGYYEAAAGVYDGAALWK
ncbi:MAG: GntR family transcriptional regulator [Eubacteriales bacterium]|nr:GntR family transcriptional regulator [Eubacteriales bacterium]